jgi:hypothetical protein
LYHPIKRNFRLQLDIWEQKKQSTMYLYSYKVINIDNISINE